MNYIDLTGAMLAFGLLSFAFAKMVFDIYVLLSNRRRRVSDLMQPLFARRVLEEKSRTVENYGVTVFYVYEDTSSQYPGADVIFPIPCKDINISYFTPLNSTESYSISSSLRSQVSALKSSRRR
ncbi:MAG: hypothetical protein V4697_02345 [Patescibacteria group bacterium]